MLFWLKSIPFVWKKFLVPLQLVIWLDLFEQNKNNCPILYAKILSLTGIFFYSKANENSTFVSTGWSLKGETKKISSSFLVNKS